MWIQTDVSTKIIDAGACLNNATPSPRGGIGISTAQCGKPTSTSLFDQGLQSLADEDALLRDIREFPSFLQKLVIEGDRGAHGRSLLPIESVIK